MGTLSKRLSVIGIYLFLLSGCSSSSFFGVNGNVNALNENPGGGGGPHCSTVLQESTQNLRISFMVDDSGSTVTTDPNHFYRVQTLETFLTKYGSKQNFTYSFGKFSGTTASIFDVNLKQFLQNPAAPFGIAANLTEALNIYKVTTPSGNTPYNAAFNTLRTAILADVAAHPGQWNHAVVFMSDGKPTDISNPVVNNLTQIVENLLLAVKNAGSSATVSTVYFGPANDTDAINNLQVMATAGKGQFANTNVNGGALSIDDVIRIPGEVCTN